MAAQTPNGQPAGSDPSVYTNGIPQTYPARKYLSHLVLTHLIHFTGDVSKNSLSYTLLLPPVPPVLLTLLLIFYVLLTQAFGLSSLPVDYFDIIYSVTVRD